MTTRNVAVVVLYNANGEVLLQHRTKDAPTFPNYWALFGGGIENNESPEQAVKRECIEELGYTLRGPSFFTVQPLDHQGSHYLIHVYVEKYDGGTLTLGEGQGMGWFSLEETKRLLMNDHDRKIVESLVLALNSGAVRPASPPQQ